MNYFNILYYTLVYAYTMSVDLSIIQISFVFQSGGVLAHSDPVLIFVFLLCFVVATISQSFLISVFFSRANLGAVSAAFLFYLSYLPYTLCVRYEDYMSMADKAAMVSKNLEVDFFCLLDLNFLPNALQVFGALSYLRFNVTKQYLYR